MLYENYIYCDLAIGGVFNRNNIVKINEVKCDGQVECYKSLYRFPVAYVEHFRKNNNSVSGYSGRCYTDYFIIDIDSEGEREAAMMKSVEKIYALVNYLETVYDFSITKNSMLFYSGMKGFHIYIPAIVFGGFQPEEDLPFKQKELAKKILIDQDYDQAIYDKNRLLRISKTKHGKSGFYKTQLEWETLLTEPTKISYYAREVRDTWKVDAEKNEGLTDVYRGIKKEDAKKARQEKIHVAASPGNRTPILMKICGSLIRDGLSKEEIKEYALFWNQKNNPPHDEDKIISTVESAFEQYSDQAVEPTVDEERQVMIDSIYTMERAGLKYSDYIKKTKGNLIRLGIGPVDKQIRGIFPGQVFGIMARTGTFKTAIAQNLMHRLVHEGRCVVFFSLEMTAPTVFERAAQMEMNIEGEAVYSIFSGSANMNDTPDGILQTVSITNKNLFIVDRSSLSIQQMKQSVKLIEDEYLQNKKVDFVVIDFMQRIKDRGRNRVEVVGNVARHVKDFAKDVDKPVLLLIQISREEKDGGQRLKLSSARDSGEIEEGCDFLAGQYIDTTANRNILRFQLLKNRQGDICVNTTEPRDEVELMINKKSLRIEPIWKGYYDGLRTQERDNEEVPF